MLQHFANPAYTQYTIEVFRLGISQFWRPIPLWVAILAAVAPLAISWVSRLVRGVVQAGQASETGGTPLESTDILNTMLEQIRKAAGDAAVAEHKSKLHEASREQIERTISIAAAMSEEMTRYASNAATLYWERIDVECRALVDQIATRSKVSADEARRIFLAAVPSESESSERAWGKQCIARFGKLMGDVRRLYLVDRIIGGFLAEYVCEVELNPGLSFDECIDRIAVRLQSRIAKDRVPTLGLLGAIVPG